LSLAVDELGNFKGTRVRAKCHLAWRNVRHWEGMNRVLDVTNWFVTVPYTQPLRANRRLPQTVEASGARSMKSKRSD